MMLALVAVCVRAWRRQPGPSRILLMVLASTAIVWQDPIMNWAPYAVYNPQLWHFPEDWPLVRLSPTVEPFIVIGYSTFYFIAPVLREHLDPAPPPGACVRPTRSCGAARSSAWRCCSSSSGSSSTRSWRSSCVRTGLYIYSQVIPWGSRLRRNDLPVPADLGVRARHRGDDSRRRPLLSRRHGTHAGREAGPAVALASAAARRSPRSW